MNCAKLCLVYDIDTNVKPPRNGTRKCRITLPHHTALMSKRIAMSVTYRISRHGLVRIIKDCINNVLDTLAWISHYYRHTTLRNADDWSMLVYAQCDWHLTSIHGKDRWKVNVDSWAQSGVNPLHALHVHVTQCVMVNGGGRIGSS